MTHTKGPWKQVENGHYKIGVKAGGIWISYDSGEGLLPLEQEANARLIAAAPDLLEALIELTARSKNFHTGNVRFADFEVAKDAMRKASAAITKATVAA